jgi:hypothetical protein
VIRAGIAFSGRLYSSSLLRIYLYGQLGRSLGVIEPKDLCARKNFITPQTWLLCLCHAEFWRVLDGNNKNFRS